MGWGWESRGLGPSQMWERGVPGAGALTQPPEHTSQRWEGSALGLCRREAMTGELGVDQGPGTQEGLNQPTCWPVGRD